MLTPQKRLDKNGQAVTRWVKVLENGEPGIKIPAPQSPALARFAESAFQNLFPSIEEGSGYLIDVVGSKWFFTADFAKHALVTLPPKTLRKLSETITGEKNAIQGYLSLETNRYLVEMYDHRTDDDIQERYEIAVAQLNNTLVFAEALTSLTVTEPYYVSAADYPYMLSTELDRYEKQAGLRAVTSRNDYGQVEDSKINYGDMPVRKQKEAIAYVIASKLTREYTSEHGLPAQDFIKFVYENLDRQKDVIHLVKERGADDVHVLSEMMNSETPAISSGML